MVDSTSVSSVNVESGPLLPVAVFVPVFHKEPLVVSSS